MALLKGRASAAFILGAYVTGVVLALNWLLKMVGQNAPTQLFGINVPTATGITTTVSTKFVAFLNGIIAFDLTQIVMLYLAAVIIIFVGALAMDYLKLPSGKNNWQRIAFILLYGTIVFYLLLVGFKMLPWQSIFGLAIWYLAVALSVNFVQKYIRI